MGWEDEMGESVGSGLGLYRKLGGLSAIVNETHVPSMDVCKQYIVPSMFQNV